MMISVDKTDKEEKKAPHQKAKDNNDSDDSNESNSWNPLQPVHVQDRSLVDPKPQTTETICNKQHKVSLVEGAEGECQGDSPDNDESMEVQARPVINFNGVQ